MYHTTYTTPPLMTDALERVYSEAALTETQPLSLKKGLRSMGRAISRSVKSVGCHIADVVSAQADARARNMLYNRTNW